MATNPYDLILVDLDDTLFDFRGAQRLAFRATMTACGLADSDGLLETFNNIQGELWRKFELRQMTKEEVFATRFDLFFKSVGHDGDGVDTNKIFLELLASMPKLLPGALEFCTHVHGRYPMVVVTNGDAATQRTRIARSALSPYLQQIVVSDDIGIGKPNPQIFWHALKVAGMSRDAADLPNPRVLMIGDSLQADIKGAAACGFDTCWVAPMSERPALAPVTPTYTVSSLMELSPLL